MYLKTLMIYKNIKYQNNFIKYLQYIFERISPPKSEIKYFLFDCSF